MVTMSQAPIQALEVAKAPLDAKKLKKPKKKEEKPTIVEDLQTTVLGIPTDTALDSKSDYRR
jgi:hypothetical protein